MLTTLKYSFLIWFGAELFPKFEDACLLEMMKKSCWCSFYLRIRYKTLLYYDEIERFREFSVDIFTLGIKNIEIINKLAFIIIHLN